MGDPCLSPSFLGVMLTIILLESTADTFLNFEHFRRLLTFRDPQKMPRFYVSISHSSRFMLLQVGTFRQEQTSCNTRRRCPKSVLNSGIGKPKRSFFIGKNRSARGGTRTRKPFGIRPSNVRVCQFHHPSVEREQTFRRRQRLASIECILLSRRRNS